VSGLISPPSLSGISRLSPAPLAAEPYVAVLPGNLFVAEMSMPDSRAGKLSAYESMSKG
jgi:hypothetical protein